MRPINTPSHFTTSLQYLKAGNTNKLRTVGKTVHNKDIDNFRKELSGIKNTDLKILKHGTSSIPPGNRDVVGEIFNPTTHVGIFEKLHSLAQTVSGAKAEIIYGKYNHNSGKMKKLDALHSQIEKTFNVVAKDYLANYKTTELPGGKKYYFYEDKINAVRDNIDMVKTALIEAIDLQTPKQG